MPSRQIACTALFITACATALVAQLRDFASGARSNDSHAQMRNMARALTVKEIEDVAEFYARHEGR